MALDTDGRDDADVPPEEDGAPAGHAAPGVAADDDAQFARTVLGLEDAVRRLDGEVDVAAEDLKELKAARDSAVRKLRNYIRAYYQPVPLFDTAARAGDPQDAWKKIPLRHVLAAFPAKKLDILEEAGLVSLADFEAFRAQHGEYAWPLKGIGPDWRSKIEEAVIDFLGKWMAKGQAQEEAAAPVE